MFFQTYLARIYISYLDSQQSAKLKKKKKISLRFYNYTWKILDSTRKKKTCLNTKQKPGKTVSQSSQSRFRFSFSFITPQM